MTNGATFSERNFTQSELQDQEHLPLAAETLNMSVVLAELDKHQLLTAVSTHSARYNDYRQGVVEAVSQYGDRYRATVGDRETVPLADAAALFLGTITLINDHPAHELEGPHTYHHGHLHGLFLCANLLDQMIGIALDNIT